MPANNHRGNITVSTGYLNERNNMLREQAEAWMNDPANAPSAPTGVSSLSPETMAEFGLGGDMVRRPDGGAEQPPHLDVLMGEKD